MMHRLPLEPSTAALGETRRVEANQTIRFGSVRYSVPKAWVDHEVWCRVEGDELVVVGRDDAGLRAIWRHELSVPGKPRVLEEHYPDHPNGRATLQPVPRPQTETERAFLALGAGAEIWLTMAAATGVSRIRAKMVTRHRVGAAARRWPRQRCAATCGGRGPPVMADSGFSTQRGTGAWEVVGR